MTPAATALRDAGSPCVELRDREECADLAPGWPHGASHLAGFGPEPALRPRLAGARRRLRCNWRE